MTRTLLVTMLVSVLLLSTACTMLRHGGSPPPSFNIQDDLKALQDEYGSAVAIKNVYQNGPTADKRDRMIAGRLVMMNLQYLQFIKSLNAEKQFIDTATEILVLSLNLSAASVSGETVKTILSAVSAGVVGSKIAIDKNFYYEKTMPALVASMNAQRKLMLTPILQGLGESLDVYPVEKAVTDLEAYYQAGTLIGAINAIQATAAEKEKEADKQNESITRARISALLPQETRNQIKTIGDAIEGLKDQDLDKAKAALGSLGYDTATIKTMPDAKQDLIATLRARGHDVAKVKEMYDIFKTTNLVK